MLEGIKKSGSRAIPIFGDIDVLSTGWLYGKPVLMTGGEGLASWVQEIPRSHKGTSGWQAKLTGGDQDGDDWAAVYIPVNEQSVKDFNTALWTYELTNLEAHGFNMVIWIHDPTDLSKRVEVTQAPSHAGLERAQGRNGHILNKETTQFFYYGEPDPVADTGLDNGTQYTWAQYQADPVFREWTIYRISIEYGWYSTGTFEAGWLTDLILNGEVILLKPSIEEALEDGELKVKTYEFSINGINFNGHAKIKTLILPSQCNSGAFVTFHHWNDAGSEEDYEVPTGKVFIAYQALVWESYEDGIALVGETVAFDTGAFIKEVLFLCNGTDQPSMENCWGTFAAGEFVTASSLSYNYKVGSALYGVEVDA